MAAAIEAYEDEEEISRQRLLATAHGGRPQAQHDPGRGLDLKLRGASYRVRVARLDPERFRVSLSTGGGAGDGAIGGAGPAAAGTAAEQADVVIERFDEHSGRIVVNGARFRLTTATHGPIHLVEVDGVTHRVSLDEGGVVRSPAPALVVATPLAAGDEVDADAPVIVLESMKMETVLRAPFRALVRECLVSVGSQVEAGAPLLRLEPVAAEDATRGAATGRRRPRRPRKPACLLPRRTCPRVSGPGGAWPTCAACCSASTAAPPSAAGCWPGSWPPAPRPAGSRSPVSWTCSRCSPTCPS